MPEAICSPPKKKAAESEEERITLTVAQRCLGTPPGAGVVFTNTLEIDLNVLLIQR